MATALARRSKLSAWSQSRLSWLLHHAWLLPVLALAAYLRFADIGSRHLYGDEAEYSIVARYLSRDFLYMAYPQIEGFGPTPFVSQPPLMLYVMAISMKILGPTDFAAMLPSILLGIGTVAAVYAVGYRLGGRLVGLSGAALLAVIPFHIEWSRHAMLDAPYTFFLVMTAYFCVAWLQERTMRRAIGVGAMTACAALTKLPGVLAGPIVLLVFAYALAITLAQKARGRASGQDVKAVLVQGGIGASIVAFGALLYVALLLKLQALTDLWVKLQWQAGRVNTGGAFVPDPNQVARDASWYFSDAKFSFNAELGGVVMALAFVGIIVAALRFARHPVKRAYEIVVPLMTLILLGFFLWSDRKEGFYLLPFAALGSLLVGIAAGGLRDMLAWANLKFTRASAPRLAPIAIAAAVLLVAVPAYGAATTSFQAYALGQTNEKYFGSGTKEAAQYIHSQHPDAAQYGTLLGRFSLYWYNEQPSYHWYMDHTYVEGEIASGHLKYIVKDKYLGLTFDDQYLDQLINAHHGKLVFESQQGWGDVKVFEVS